MFILTPPPPVNLVTKEENHLNSSVFCAGVEMVGVKSAPGENGQHENDKEEKS